MDNTKYSHRKQQVTIRVINESGAPVSNSNVAINQTNHEFLFGCGAFDTLSINTDSSTGPINFYDDKKRPDASFYQDRVDKWTQVFNYGTLPFYWGGYEPTEGDVKFESRMNAAKYLVNHNAKVKGHPLCWHTACADWLMEYDNKTIMDKQLKRIERDVIAFKGVVDMWDVINETVIMPVYDRYDNAITRICNEYGRTTLIKEVFDAAKAANPDAVLLINDFNLSKNYQAVIEECLDKDVPISAIGIQTHQHQGYRGLDWLMDILDRFSIYNIPLHFTENTLVSGDIMPADIVDLNDYQVDSWPSTPEGEARQEKEWKEMYETLFGHPSVEAITGWDFADGAWLHAPSGLIRQDNSVKPSYNTLKRLIHEEWHTSENLTTNANGEVSLTGFRGSYDITCNGSKASFTIDKNSNTITVTVK